MHFAHFCQFHKLFLRIAHKLNLGGGGGGGGGGFPSRLHYHNYGKLVTIMN